MISPCPSQFSQRPPFDVEAEASRFVASDLAFGKFGEKTADVVEHFRIGARIAAGRAADWALIDIYDLVNFVRADDSVMRSRTFAAAVDKLRQATVKRLHYQRRLAAAADPGYTDEFTQGKPNINILEIIRTRAL